jgi:hypothetical protein
LNYREIPRRREDPQQIISSPNIDDAVENAERRALLWARHRALWDELPIGTEWHEVRINEQALNQVRVFPRAHWRKLAQGNYSVTWVTEGLRAGRHALDERFLSKITAIGRHLSHDEAGFGTVILLGMNEREPLTVLDGNHRLVAAMLLSPGDLSRLRFVCGFSPRMNECCWYKTNVATLFRYARHVLARAIRNPRVELDRLLYSTRSSTALAEPPGTALAALAETNDVRP